MIVKDIMRMGLPVLSTDTMARDAAAYMKGSTVDALLVSKDSSIDGVITAYDIAAHVVANGDDPAATRIGEIMEMPQYACEEGQSVEDAANLMKNQKVPELIVLRNGEPVGIIFASDIVKNQNIKIIDETARRSPGFVSR